MRLKMVEKKFIHAPPPVSLCLLAVALSLMSVGCTESGDDPLIPSTPTVTATAVPSATPTPDEGGGHTEIEFGSTQAAAGALALHEIEESFDIPFAQCLGGGDDECTGGTLVYVGLSPGLEPVPEDEPEESIYALADGTPIILEVVVIDDGLSIRLEGKMVQEAGESVALGTTPDLHADLEWVLAIPPGAEAQHPYAVVLKLTTTSSAYSASEQFTVTFVPTTDGDHHEDE